MEQELTKYLTDKLLKHNQYITLKLLKMFGGDNISIINDAFCLPVMFKITSSMISFYKSIYDSLTLEEQEMIDYFESKLVDKDYYIIGASTGNITDYMYKNASRHLSISQNGNFITLSAFSVPTNVYMVDNSYLYALIKYIAYHIMVKVCYNGRNNIFNLSECLKKIINDNAFFNDKMQRDINDILNKIRDEAFIFNYDNLITDLICRSLSTSLVDSMHEDGIYVLDNKNIIEDYEEARRDIFDNFTLEHNYDYDLSLLSSLNSILPLCFTNYSRFIYLVGLENFNLFVNAIKSDDKDKVYIAIEEMVNSYQFNTGNSIIIDTDSIKDAIDRISGEENLGYKR